MASPRVLIGPNIRTMRVVIAGQQMPLNLRELFHAFAGRTKGDGVRGLAVIHIASDQDVVSTVLNGEPS